MNNTTACYAFAVAFIAAGILSFVPTPPVAAGDVLSANAMHNSMYILTGIIFAAGAMLGHPRLILLVMGAVYAVVALLGFLLGGDMILGIVRINMADNVFHLVIAIAILAAGFGLSEASKRASKGKEDRRA